MRNEINARIHLIEKYERIWTGLPKDRVVEDETPRGEKRVSVAFELAAPELGTRQIYLAVVIGRRGGLREELIVLDPGKLYVIDRLLLSSVQRDIPVLLDRLGIMRMEIRNGGEPLEVCRRILGEEVERLRKKPETGILSLRARSGISNEPEIRMLGSAFGMGKRR